RSACARLRSAAAPHVHGLHRLAASAPRAPPGPTSDGLLSPPDVADGWHGHAAGVGQWAAQANGDPAADRLHPAGPGPDRRVRVLHDDARLAVPRWRTARAGDAEPLLHPVRLGLARVLDRAARAAAAVLWP